MALIRGRCGQQSTCAAVILIYMWIKILSTLVLVREHIKTPVPPYEQNTSNQTTTDAAIPPHYNRQFQKYINCAKLFQGDKEEQKKAMEVTKRVKFTFAKDSDYTYLNMTSDCKAFLRQRKYIKRPLSSTEAAFPIAYTILMHSGIEQTERLLRAIYHPQNIYCIHIDRKATDGVKRTMMAIVNCLPNVFVSSKLETVIYEGFSRLQAELNCMKDLLKSSTKWKYYLNLPSQVFPLKTNLELVKIFQIYNGANDIEYAPLRKDRFIYSHKVREGRLVRTSTKKSSPPHQLKIVKGSAYGAFSHDFVDYAVNNHIAKDLLVWSRDTKSPDEHFWATLHHLQMNPQLSSPGGYKGLPEEKPWLAAYVSWQGRDPCVSKKYIHWICIFGMGDLPFLIHRKELFLNKVHLNFEPFTYQCLEEWIYNRTISPLPFETSYYKGLPFIRK